MRHSSKSLSFFFPFLFPYHFFWKGIFRTYLIFRTLLEWFGVSSLCPVEPCFSPAPADSVLCVDYAAFPLDSLTHMLSCFCLKNKNQNISWYFFYLNSDFFSSWKCWYLPCFSLFPRLLVFLPFISSYPLSSSFCLLMSSGSVQMRQT